MVCKSQVFQSYQKCCKRECVTDNRFRASKMTVIHDIYKSKQRRGMIAIDYLFATVVFLIMAGLAMKMCFDLMALLHHVVSTLVGWPIL